MHCGCHFMGWFGKLSWLIVSLAAINIGLMAAGVWNFGELSFVADNPRMAMIVAYVVGLCGAVSLLGLIMASYRCMSGSECQTPHNR